MRTFRELNSLKAFRLAEQNLCAHSMPLIGDKNPWQHEFSVQLRALQMHSKSGAKLGVVADRRVKPAPAPPHQQTTNRNAPLR